MHSRIFQVSLEPIERDEYLDESDFYEHWFVGAIADYVVDSEDREYDIKWLNEAKDAIKVDKDDYGYYLVVPDKYDYFELKYNRFLRELKKLENTTLNEFVDKALYLYDLNDSYNDKYSFYINADGEMMTIDDFVRLCVVNTKYYIGATLDYHC